MAVINKVRAGDTLQVPIKVVYIELGRYPGGPIVARVEMPDGREESLSRTDVEAAEHIPAPKQFKRGDWVRLGSVIVPWAETDLFRHGWVTGTSGAGRVLVSWPHAPQSLDSLEPQNLEHDEAPE